MVPLIDRGSPPPNPPPLTRAVADVLRVDAHVGLHVLVGEQYLLLVVVPDVLLGYRPLIYRLQAWRLCSDKVGL